ncbi:hypothetical protein GCM10022222_17460 [Amycolatopsis ultiminotia]|uniref:Uncharacterized protein n=1 Tax=Amycolatopsis ultiminotia TaxID=543629 RepID=A0ABP6VG75_9PSEU
MRYPAALRRTATEVAVLEVLADGPTEVEVEPSEAVRQLADLLRSGKVRPDRLGTAARTEPGQARARLK